jgi:hypothetical protein
MISKKLIYISTLLVLIIVSIIILLFVLTTEDKLSIIEPLEYSSMEDYKKQKLQGAFDDVVNNIQNTLVFTMDEYELNEILALEYKEFKDKGEEMALIKGFKGEIIGNRIKITFNSNVMKIIPTQYIVELIPSIENNKLVFFVSSITMGKLKIPKSIFLKRIKTTENEEFYIDIEKSIIVINNKLPDQFALKSIEIKNNKIELQVGVFIQSIKDLLKVIGTVLPDDLSKFLEEISLDSIKNEDINSIKEMSIKQVNQVVNSIKFGIIKETVNKLISTENEQKLKDKLGTIAVDLLKITEDKVEEDSNKDTDVSESIDNIKTIVVDIVKEKLDNEGIDKKLEILDELLHKTKD